MTVILHSYVCFHPIDVSILALESVGDNAVKEIPSTISVVKSAESNSNSTYLVVRYLVYAKSRWRTSMDTVDKED